MSVLENIGKNIIMDDVKIKEILESFLESFFRSGKLLTLLPDCVADILNLHNDHTERNLTGIKEKLRSLDCIERDEEYFAYMTVRKAKISQPELGRQRLPEDVDVTSHRRCLKSSVGSCCHQVPWCRRLAAPWGFISLGPAVNKRAPQVLEQYSSTCYGAEIKIIHSDGPQISPKEGCLGHWDLTDQIQIESVDSSRCGHDDEDEKLRNYTSVSRSTAVSYVLFGSSNVFWFVNIFSATGLAIAATVNKPRSEHNSDSREIK
ncbi:PREDICTED: uncharacterized protein LOC104372435, partial [Tauraco erythrolophus]|uniref:uncharacterized protein LOC104372435 n=1 Tax=Tauraco erythrolophus TaxID=121530 RepID=UPI000523C0A6